MSSAISVTEIDYYYIWILENKIKILEEKKFKMIRPCDFKYMHYFVTVMT